MIRIGVDFGGTKIEAAALDAEGRFQARVRADNPGAYEAALGVVRDLVAEAERQAGATGSVGVGMPGIGLRADRPDPQRQQPLPERPAAARPTWRPLSAGRCGSPTTPTAWRSRRPPTAPAPARASSSPPSSAPAAAAGVVAHGQLVEGLNRVAGEWGHTPLPWPTADETAACRPAGAASRGCLELYLSGRGLEADHARAGGRGLSAEAIVRDARRRRCDRRRRARPLCRPPGARAGGDRQHPRPGRDRAGRRHVERGRALRRGCPPPSRRMSSPATARRRFGPPCTATPPACAAPRGSGRRRERALPRLLLDRRSGAPSAARAAARRRLVVHPDLMRLTIAHLDCDAFYASVEKRDRPELRDQPVIVGGGKRGVVTTCCYIARLSGVRSAMPMFQARRLCPEAVVIPPAFSKYRAESARDHGQARRADAAGAAAVAGRSLDRSRRLGAPARRDGRRSAGAAAGRDRARSGHHRLDRARRQQVPGQDRVGSRQAARLLGDRRRGGARRSSRRRPASILPGVGPAFARALAAAGFKTVGDLARADRAEPLQTLGRIWPAAFRARPRPGRPPREPRTRRASRSAPRRPSSTT